MASRVFTRSSSVDNTSRMHALSEMFMFLDKALIQLALNQSSGDMNRAVDHLLGAAALALTPTSPPAKSLKTSDSDWRVRQAGASQDAMELSEGPNYFPLLPWELFIEIMSFLGKKELCALRCVNSTWRDLLDSDQIWKDLVKRQYGHQDTGSFESWKNLYVDLDRLRWSVVQKSEKIELLNDNRTAKDICKGDEKYRWVTALSHNYYASGQHYVEVMVDACCDNTKNTIKIGFGLVDKCTVLTHNCPFGYSYGTYSTNDHNSWVYLADGRIMAKNKFTGMTGNQWSKNDRIGVLIDFFAQRVVFYWNSRPQGNPLPLECEQVSVAVSLIGGNQVTFTGSSINSIMPLP
jgi:hypothetical protein